MNKTEKYYENTEEWIKDLMNNSAYTYAIKREYYKLFLYIKITGNRYLEIPVYYEYYQKTVPQILESIQQYGNVVKNSQIEAYIRHSLNSAQWLNQIINRNINTSQISINEIIEKKLVIFLNKKLREIIGDTQDDNSKYRKSLIISKKGFKVNSLHDMIRRCKGYIFSNKNGCRCYLLYKGRPKREFICMEIDGISSSDLQGTIGGLYRCMDEIDEIAKEFRQIKKDLKKQKENLQKQAEDLSDEQIKHEKVIKISQNSINTWIKMVMQNQQYSYYVSESENRITLSIKLKNNLQLDIPIYYSSFQKIIPVLLESIQQFENTANNSKIEVLIKNKIPKQQWINQK